MPNKYVGILSLSGGEFECQITALCRIASDGIPEHPFLETTPGCAAALYGKNYYEPARTDLLRLVPASAATVLSIGCGWGATEETLARTGRRVVAVPMDPIISACAEAKGVEVMHGVEETLASIRCHTFDCVLVSNVLHLVKEPTTFLTKLLPALSCKGIIITAVPNLFRVPVLWKRIRGLEPYRFLGDYRKSGVHLTSHGIVHRWLTGAGLRVRSFADVMPERAQALCSATFGLAAPLMSSEIVALAEKL
jgi:2-polyprenyl-3-methyl-5-hydroxy-6-metoxy-1,4-benzoquinol methylase